MSSRWCSMTVFFLCFLLTMFLSGVAGAQSLSDLSMKQFESETSKYQVQSHVDPFSSGVSAAEDLSIEDLQLSGIVFRDTKDAYALISGYLVRPGDMIAGYRVEKVEKDRVRLRRIDDVFVLALGGGI